MADNKDLTEINQVNIAISGDLVYLVTSDADGVSSSVAITKDNFLKSTVTGVNRIISGQVVWTGTGFTHKSVNLSYEINRIIYFLNGTTITNDTPDGSNPRFDQIFVDSSGLAIKDGTPAGSPTVPSLDNPDSEISTNIVLVTNGETTPTGVTLETLYSENLQESGGEWDTDSSSTAVRIILASTADPINLTVDIKTQGVIADDFFSLFNTTAIAIADFQNLRHTFRSLEDWKKDYLRLSFLDGATEAGYAYITKDSFDTKDLLTDQDVFINKDMVSWVSGENQFDKIVYLWVDAGGASPVTTARFQVDLIKIETGGITTDSQTNIITAAKVSLKTDNFSGNLSSADNTSQKAFDTIDDIAIGGGDMLLAATQTVTGLKTFEAVKFALRNVADTFNALFTNTNTADRTYTLPDASGTIPLKNGVKSSTNSFIVVCSNFETDLETKVLSAYFDLPYDFTFTEIIGTVITAPTGSSIIADVNVDGSTIMTTDKVEIEATEDSSLDATTQPTITDASHSKGQRVSFDIDQIGSTIAGTDLEIELIGYQS